MMDAFRFVPPAGTPISVADLLGSIGAAMTRADTLMQFKEAVRVRVGVRYCDFVSTGRAALTLALLALKALDGGKRDEVVIPAYTCFSVPSSVIKAGLKVRLADVNPITLDFLPAALENLDGSRVLAVVATNLYGLPSDLPSITRLAHDRSIYVVDDAAQCLGGQVGGRPSGTWGDVGIYSFDKGKNVTSIDGGVLVTNSDQVAEAIARQVRVLPKCSMGESASHLAKLLVYVALLHPQVYWLPNSLPFLGLGTTAYRTDYPLAQYDSWMAPVGHRLFARLDAITAQRRANADRLKQLLPWGPLLDPVLPGLDAVPAYLRYPVLIDPDYRDAVVAALKAHGIGASASYPTAINDIQELQRFLQRSDRKATGGRDLARRILTLPTHGYVTEQDQDRISAVIEDVLSA
jgi:perosamine synthetase